MRRLPSFLFFAIGVILAFNPAYALFAILAQEHLSASIINAFKYLPYFLLITVLILSLWVYISRHGLPNRSATPNPVFFAFLTLCWGAISIALSSASTFQAVRGFNVDFSGLILFVSLWLLAPREEISRRLRAVIIATLGFLAVISIPEIFFNRAYRIWAHHQLDNHFVVQKIPQLRSLTSGPNPFGTLLGLLGALLGRYIGNQWLQSCLILVSGFLMGLTYARSAWGGIAIAGGGLFFYLLRKKKFVLWPLVLGFAILLGASYGSIRYHEGVLNVLTHGKSTDEHAKTAENSLKATAHQTPLQTLVGHGVGTAGPVIFGTPEEKKTDVPKIVESWYLQLIAEVGIIGIILYMITYISLIKTFFRKKMPFYAWLTIGLGVNAITLHTWSADVNLNVMFWSLAALAIYSLPKLEPKTKKL
ncbi:MAG: O-antigen ligase family protein [Candidatus Saccharibacteria bacterium]